MEDVLEMKYFDQHEHFTEFLGWLKAGNHTNRSNYVSNNTCNSYLHTIFGFYEFYLLEYEFEGKLRVLEKKEIGYNSSVGVRFRRSISQFKGYLPNEKSKRKTIKKDKLITILSATKSLRTKLIILLLAETGFRISEILGIRMQDVDFDRKRLKIVFREDNPNGARAKNAEERYARVSDDTFDMLLIYIADNKELIAKSDFLLVSTHGKTKGKPLTKSAVNSSFGVIEDKTGIKITPHMLRHYYADERYYNANWDIVEVSRALGHKHIQTTLNYLSVHFEDMEDAMEEYLEENGSLYDIAQIV